MFRYSKESDYDVWSGRLIVDELELSDIKTVEKYCEYLKTKYRRIHILINNAAQTITRPDGWVGKMNNVNHRSYLHLSGYEESLNSEWNEALKSEKNNLKSLKYFVDQSEDIGRDVVDGTVVFDGSIDFIEAENRAHSTLVDDEKLLNNAKSNIQKSSNFECSDKLDSSMGSNTDDHDEGITGSIQNKNKNNDTNGNRSNNNSNNNSSVINCNNDNTANDNNDNNNGNGCGQTNLNDSNNNSNNKSEKIFEPTTKHATQSNSTHTSESVTTHTNTNRPPVGQTDTTQIVALDDSAQPLDKSGTCVFVYVHACL